MLSSIILVFYEVLLESLQNCMKSKRQESSNGKGKDHGF